MGNEHQDRGGVEASRTPVEVADGATLILRERRGQVEREGWSPEHDQEHDREELACAAIVYAMSQRDREFRSREGTQLQHLFWPLGWNFKPTPDDRVRELVKAGALIAAEIDRLNGTTPVPPSPEAVEPPLTCVTCGKDEDAPCDCGPERHLGFGVVRLHTGVVNCMYGHPFVPPSPEAVEPPLTGGCAKCGIDLDADQDALATHHFLYDHAFERKPVETVESSQEGSETGGEWRRAETTVISEEWRNSVGGRYRLPKSLVRDISRDAEERALAVERELRSQRDTACENWQAWEERATQAEGQREALLELIAGALNTGMEFHHEGGCSAVEAWNSHNQICTCGADEWRERARALSPSTEAPSEEK